MATKKRRDRVAPVPVTRRGPGAERKGLSPELEEFARSDDEKLRIRTARRPRLKDPRANALVPGVANRDARAILDARTERLARWAKEAKGNDERLDRGLAELVFCRAWRGRSLTAFEAYAEDFLGIPAAEAIAAAERGAAALGVPCEPLNDEAIAVWMRAEAGALEVGAPLRVRPGPGDTLHFEVEVPSAPMALHAAGRRMTPLVQDRESHPGPSRR